MSFRNRREFLQLCAASVSGAILGPAGEAITVQSAPPSLPSAPEPSVKLPRFVDPLPVPGRLRPVRSTRQGDEYVIHLREFSRRLHSHLPPARLWGFEGEYPGPTFEAWRGRPVVTEWHNDLPKQHLFAVDPHIHGARPPAPAVRTVTHLHGACTPSFSDGLPENWITPGQSVRYTWPNVQQSATLWYHDHAMGITRLNVYAGLSGFYLLRDEQERALNLPAGDYEIPLVVQDRTVNAQGQLVYAPRFEDGVALPPGVWGSEFFGEQPLVNGAIFPYLEVEPRAYRFRVLNACNSRFVRLFLNLAKSILDIPHLVRFNQIGSDGGLLPAPVAMEKLLLGPAERADLIVDFSGLEGKTLSLTNDAATPFPGWSMMTVPGTPLDEFMQFRVTRPLRGARTVFTLPPAHSAPAPGDDASIPVRDFVLSEAFDAKGRSLGMRINNKGYEDPVTEIVRLGSVEKWRFINTTDDTHPMHVHLVQFRILERQGYDVPTMLGSGKLKLVGMRRAPEPNEVGRKDTALVNPGEVLTILVHFEGYLGRYVYHCHMAEHEDNDMMRPFEVIAADAPPPAENKTSGAKDS
ncbi:MAG TPA: multicopper oxidase [Acidobacteriaceae bacterium]|jgi:spore coat protein A|nr:multicopper oxidase [Acidobacteriaceae bacterium]